MGRATIKLSEFKQIIKECVYQIITESARYEPNQIGSIEYSSSFDEDDYKEWLQDNGLTNNQNTLRQFYIDNVSFELDLTDSETFHHMDYQDMDYSDIVEEYSQEIADRILQDCMSKGGGQLEMLEYACSDIDINNPEELNAEAAKLLTNGRYYKGARGFILTNGVMVYTEAEHNMVTRINGVNNTFHFISLGNIRVLPNSIDMAKKPTDDQLRVLQKIIQAYSRETLYVDYVCNGRHMSKAYNNPTAEMVFNDIRRMYG